MKMKTKTTNIIQRLCLFLFVLVLAAPAWATDYGREGYETFRSRDLGTHQTVRTLRKGNVEITFSRCNTTGGTGNRAIYELAKGSRINVEVDDGYAIRWIILRDTEGGEDYDEPNGIKRISSVTSGYDYYFERNAISNSGISGANQNNLNDDDNNIVVYNYDATSQSVDIYTHNNSRWGQFKVRDIIVGYVKVPKVRFEKDSYDVYTVSNSFMANLDKGEYDGNIEYYVDNNEIADVNNDGSLKLKRPGTVGLTAIFPSNEKFAKAQCGTTINVKRDRVTFNYQVPRPKVLYYQGDGYANAIYNLYDYSDFTTESGIPYNRGNDGFNVECTNSDVLSIEKTIGRCFFERTAGTVTVTMTQHENNLYAESSLRQTFTVIRTDKGANTMLIKDLNEWKVFAHLVNDEGVTNLNARLEADIDLGSDITMVGTYDHKYSGTFDGQNHTLMLNWDSGATSDIAPFKKVDGATIKNLRTQGTIKSSSYYLSGLIDEAYGKTSVSNCVSNVNITSSYTNDRCGAAGMISYIGSSGNITITDCLVEGNINATTDNGKKGMGGFVYSQNGTCTLNNCLYLGDNNATSNSYTFAYNATVNNCYYLKNCGSKQGEQATQEQLKNGEVAYQLQKSRNEQVWGQTIGTNNEPQLIAFDNSAKKVYQVNFTYKDQVKATRYANSGKTVSLPTTRDIVGSSYNEHHYYTIAFTDNFNENTTVTGDKQVTVSITEKDAYEIGSADEWNTFSNLVIKGENGLDAKLTADIDLGVYFKMVGDYYHPYFGTFDGQGHTLTMNWDSGNDQKVGVFNYVKDCTIKNLRLEGKITANADEVGGLIYSAKGNSTISGCVSNLQITNKYKDGRMSGLISVVFDPANVTINDCIVKGDMKSMNREGNKDIVGFVKRQYDKCTLNNCLYIGTNNADSQWARTFCNNANLNNCYYLNPCGTAQGTQITEEQLKNGEVAHLLQNGRDTQFWGQKLGTDNEPMPTTDEAKHIYKVDFAYNNEVKATRYATRNNAIYGDMPTFTAQGLMGSEYNEHHYYTLAFAGDFNGSTTVSSDQTVAVLFNHKEAYEIGSTEDWATFCNLVKGGQTKLDAKMTQDIDLGGEIVRVGNQTNEYAGTFDGQGHTLSIDWNSKGGENAPFYYVNGATIKNLRTQGKNAANGSKLSGLIVYADGSTTLSGCVSEVDLKGASELAGMIYDVDGQAQVTFNDCVVKGDITATTDAGKTNMAGFVYQLWGYCTFNNCLYTGTNTGSNGSNTFARTKNLTNCYYLNPCGNTQGTRVTEEQLRNGEVAYLLQNGRDTQFWGQTLGTDNEPLLTSDEAKHIYKVGFTYNGEATAARYANKGGTVSLPTLQEALGNSYNPHHYYTGLAFADGFNGSTTVNADRTVAITLTEKDCYEIASKDDWKALRDLVNNGQPAVDVKLTQDVDLGTEIVMVADTWPNRYYGTFDGQGHTLSFSWDAGDRREIAPFKYVKDATIRNLRTQGKITSSGYDSQLSGLIQNAEGTTTISGCVSEVDLKGSSSLAGILQWADDEETHVTINDCLVKGTFHATSDLNGGKARYICGFIAHKHGKATCTLNNCLYLGTNNALDHDETSFTFCSESELNEGTGFTRITNCYYLNACGKVQGDRVTAEQLKNGHVAKLLQAGRTDQCHWAQPLGETPGLYREADKSKTNYVYYDTANSRWACEDFRLTDAKPLPIGLDFIAARATYERTFAASGKATICLPYELPANGFKAYTLSGGDNSAVHFADAKDKLEAYKPYLITVDGVPQLGGENIQVKAYKADVLKQTAAGTGHSFTGTVAGLDNAAAAAANAYILQDDGKFHKVTTDYPTATVPAYRAYVTCPKGAGAKQLSIVIDGETTGIGGATNDARGRADGPVYDLQGRRVADRLDDAARHRLPAGVYIVGGRKVILK